MSSLAAASSLAGCSLLTVSGEDAQEVFDVGMLWHGRVGLGCCRCQLPPLLLLLGSVSACPAVGWVRSSGVVRVVGRVPAFLLLGSAGGCSAAAALAVARAVASVPASWLCLGLGAGAVLPSRAGALPHPLGLYSTGCSCCSGHCCRGWVPFEKQVLWY